MSRELPEFEVRELEGRKDEYKWSVLKDEHIICICTDKDEAEEISLALFSFYANE